MGEPCDTNQTGTGSLAIGIQTCYVYLTHIPLRNTNPPSQDIYNIFGSVRYIEE